MSFNMKYFFESNVRVDSGDVTTQRLGYDDGKSAEIKYHDEVSYGLKLNNLVLAYYSVVNERGETYKGLRTIIDNTEQYED